jgi:hypothetical protein
LLHRFNGSVIDEYELALQRFVLNIREQARHCIRQVIGKSQENSLAHFDIGSRQRWFEILAHLPQHARYVGCVFCIRPEPYIERSVLTIDVDADSHAACVGDRVLCREIRCIDPECLAAECHHEVVTLESLDSLEIAVGTGFVHCRP